MNVPGLHWTPTGLREYLELARQSSKKYDIMLYEHSAKLDSCPLHLTYATIADTLPFPNWRV